MALDPLAIASDGLLSKHDWTLSAGTRGYISQYSIVVIDIPAPGGGNVQSIGYLLTDKDELGQKENILYREDEEVMLIIQIFMMRWN